MIDSRLSSELLFQEAQKQHLDPQWFNEVGLFTIQLNGQRWPLFHTKLPFNSQLAGYLAQNKYFTHQLLEAAHLPTIPYSLPQNEQDIAKFLDRYQQVIIKPTMGMKARGVRLLTQEKGNNLVEQLHGIDWKISLLEKYVKGTEYRVLLLNGELLGILRKEAAPTPTIRWHKRKMIETDPTIFELLENQSLQAMRALGLHWGAVDWIVNDNEKVILEINSAPGISSFHYPDEGKGINVAEKILKGLKANY